MIISLPRRPLASLAWILPLFSWLGIASAVDLDRSAVPIVGCPEDGQTGPMKAQVGQSMPVPLDQNVAAQIAFYSAADSPGIFGPRGWHCQGWSGLNGSLLLVTPQRIPPPYFPLPVVTGPAVMIRTTDAETSGRFHVAIVASRLFSVVGGEFIARVRQEHLISESSFDVEPYSDDQLQYLSDRFVRYMTPANHNGLGTEDLFEVSNLPVRGLTILNLETETNSLTEVRVRLPAGLNSGAEAIVQLETACLQRQRGCRGLK